MGSRKSPTVIPQMAIVGMSKEGIAYGLSETSRTIYVENGVVGDVGDVQVFKRQRGASLGKIINWHTRSPLRLEPTCEHFDLCGGCKWQFVAYAQQLLWKRELVRELFSELTDLEIPPVIPSPQTYFYRHKLEFSATNDRWLEDISSAETLSNKNALGYHVPNRWSKIFQVHYCHLQADPSNAIRQYVQAVAEELAMDFYDPIRQIGTLRNLIIRTTNTGELMVIVSFYPTQQDQQHELLKQVTDKFPQITSLYSVQNNKGNDTIYDCELYLYSGKPYITETLGDLRFAITPKSFFQVNINQAVQLFQIVQEFANIDKAQTVYDLYCGTGAIALTIAHSAKQVIGIEIIADAIKDAQFNAQINQITNVKFCTGDMKDIFQPTLINEYGKPDLVITDPPRSGMTSQVMQQLLNILPTKLIYVSCNPITQARDVQSLSNKYVITKIQPVDMFPQTAHLENVVLMELIP